MIFALKQKFPSPKIGEGTRRLLDIQFGRDVDLVADTRSHDLARAEGNILRYVQQRVCFRIAVLDLDSVEINVVFPDVML